MRKILLAVAGTLALAAGFVASPFVAAWSIREAIQTGNSDYLAEKIEWDSVRVTLRQSLVAYSMPIVPVVDGETADAAAKPGLWQRVKAALSRRAVDRLVDSYVTPEGLPQLFEYRQMYRRVSGDANAERPSFHVRAQAFWKRVKRAEFLSPTEFEFEMADRTDPSRHYVGLLKLRGLEWKLAELRVKPAVPPETIAAADEIPFDEID